MTSSRFSRNDGTNLDGLSARVFFNFSDVESSAFSKTELRPAILNFEVSAYLPLARTCLNLPSPQLQQQMALQSRILKCQPTSLDLPSFA